MIIEASIQPLSTDKCLEMLQRLALLFCPYSQLVSCKIINLAHVRNSAFFLCIYSTFTYSPHDIYT